MTLKLERKWRHVKFGSRKLDKLQLWALPCVFDKGFEREAEKFDLSNF